MIRFERPVFLLLIGLSIPAYIYFYMRLKTIRSQFSLFPNTDAIVRAVYIRNMLFMFAGFFLITALAIPLWGSKKIITKHRGTSVIFVMDISRSMTVADTPPNRLSFAKRYTQRLIENLDKTACGLVIAKGRGILAVPLSFSRRSIITAVESLKPGSESSTGTNLEQGIRAAISAFPKNHAAAKIIVLCTDGGQTSGNLGDALRLCMQEGIRTIIIGFGTTSGGTVSVFNEGGEELLIKSCLDEDFLKTSIAETGYHNYISALESSSALKVLRIIDFDDTDSKKNVSIQEPVRRIFECTAGAFFCIVLGFFLEAVIWKKK